MAFFVGLSKYHGADQDSNAEILGEVLYSQTSSTC